MDTPQMFLVVNIGCIDCGVSSDIVGVFETEAQANQIASDCWKKYRWREGGENAFEVFPLPEVGVINPNYEL
ncbi:MAG: hypothetical protein A4E65_03706 [Syntrophorhabdus sp. PtaU1.Bin153]|nr:MAG: hypothetical protein A4E65_03706 [Syntrophorhabdus sp. PtaU1.Bin153]